MRRLVRCGADVPLPEHCRNALGGVLSANVAQSRHVTDAGFAHSLFEKAGKRRAEWAFLQITS
jgi:hypothetical protein